MRSNAKNTNLCILRNLLEEYELDSNSQIIPQIIHETPAKFENSQKIISMISLLKQNNKDLTLKYSTLQEDIQVLEKKNLENLEVFSQEKLKFEGMISRNLIMIENLLKDKQVLNEELEKLLREKNDLEHKIQENANFFREKLKNELKTQKENLENLEKQRKKQWIYEKSKEIKEITVRGLEPELARILENHKKEIKSLEENYKNEVINEKTQLKQNFEEMKENLLLDFDYKDEMNKRKYEKLLQEELRKQEVYWEAEKERICQRFEYELEQKEKQRKIEGENFELKMKLFQEKKGESFI